MSKARIGDNVLESKYATHEVIVVEVYQGGKVYGPYKRSDGREHVVIVYHDKDGSISKQSTVSYPKYIVETYLGRYLTPQETVDHIDGDFTNNSLSNLRIVDRSVHCRSHVSSRITFTKNCIICGKEFHTCDLSTRTCGDRSCRGRCSYLTRCHKLDTSINTKSVLVSNRNIVDHIKPVTSLN